MCELRFVTSWFYLWQIIHDIIWDTFCKYCWCEMKIQTVCTQFLLLMYIKHPSAIHMLEDCYVLLILKNWHKNIIWNHNLAVLYKSLKMNLIADFSMPVFKTAKKYTQCHVSLLFVQVFIFTMFNNACVFIERHLITTTFVQNATKKQCMWVIHNFDT